MIDTSKLYDYLNNFEKKSKPSLLNKEAPATIGDIKRLADETAKMFEKIIDELE